jgi:hypothetical protein
VLLVLVVLVQLAPLLWVGGKALPTKQPRIQQQQHQPLAYR